MAQKLFLLDGSAIYYRSYFAFIRNPLINSKGENTSATFGFLNTLIKLIEDEKPDFLTVVFDTKAPTFRHEIYPEYKATRQRMPEEMAAQFPRLVDSLQRLKFVLLEKEGFEADDIIGTLAKRYAAPECQVFIVSGDKDMAQLVNENVRLYSLPRTDQRAEILGIDGVKAKLGLFPGQVTDWLALMGDASDNIPGVPKVGEKTAVSLLQEFGSLDEIYRRFAEVKTGKVKENLELFREQTALSKKLATIETETPIDVSLSDLKFRWWNPDEAVALMQELEFRRLSQRFHTVALANVAELEGFKNFKAKDSGYELIADITALRRLADELNKLDYLTFDLETSSLDMLDTQIAGIALSWKKGSGCYIPVNHPDLALPEAEVLEILRPVLSNPQVKKIAHNMKFDAMILGQHGLPVEGKYFDTLIAAYLIDPSGQHKLDRLSELYLNYHMIPIEDLIGSGRNQKTMIEIPAGEVANYAAEDADMTMQLFEIFREKLDSAGMSDLFYKLEMPLLPVLMAMEKQGVLLDWPMLKTLSAEISIQISALEKQIYQQAGKVFNLNSPLQLGLILFDDLQIHRDLGGRKPSKTKTGQYSTSEPSLQKFEAHPLVAALLEYRKLTKLKNTYIDAFPELIHPKTGRVHTSYNQTVAATGRLSSSNPNLQNIPIRTEIGREMRRAFIPSESGLVMVSADYSQIELRIMAHLSGDENMIRSFKNGQDIHASTAARVFNIGLDEVNSDQRRKAKEINFGIIYGMSRYGLAARLQISNEEAEAFIQGYFANYPGIKQYMNQCIQKAAALGYVETMLKRRRYLPEIRSTNRQIREFAERTAINTPIQGSAADMIKLAMIDIHGWIESEKVPARMILQVHDELVFEVSETVVAEISQKIKELMTRAMSLQVPLLVETGFGAHWLAAHE